MTCILRTCCDLMVLTANDSVLQYVPCNQSGRIWALIPFVSDKSVWDCTFTNQDWAKRNVNGIMSGHVMTAGLKSRCYGSTLWCSMMLLWIDMCMKRMKLQSCANWVELVFLGASSWQACAQRTEDIALLLSLCLRKMLAVSRPTIKDPGTFTFPYQTSWFIIVWLSWLCRIRNHESLHWD